MSKAPPVPVETWPADVATELMDLRDEEADAIAHYAKAIGMVKHPELRAVLEEILLDEQDHLALLEDALGIGSPDAS